MAKLRFKPQGPDTPFEDSEIESRDLIREVPNDSRRNDQEGMIKPLEVVSERVEVKPMPLQSAVEPEEVKPMPLQSAVEPSDRANSGASSSEIANRLTAILQDPGIQSSAFAPQAIPEGNRTVIQASSMESNSGANPDLSHARAINPFAPASTEEDFDYAGGSRDFDESANGLGGELKPITDLKPFEIPNDSGNPFARPQMPLESVAEPRVLSDQAESMAPSALSAAMDALNQPVVVHASQMAQTQIENDFNPIYATEQVMTAVPMGQADAVAVAPLIQHMAEAVQHAVPINHQADVAPVPMNDQPSEPIPDNEEVRKPDFHNADNPYDDSGEDWGSGG